MGGTGAAARRWPGRARRPDPSALFADYPTRRLAPQTRLVLAPGLPDAKVALARVLAFAAIPGLAARGELLPGAETFRAALTGLAGGSATAAALVAELSPEQAASMCRAVAWLVKVDVLRPAEDEWCDRG